MEDNSDNDNPNYRDTGHDPERQWRSTSKPLFNRAMTDELGGDFDSIQFSDLEGDNSIALIFLFAQRIGRHPPLKSNNEPYSSGTLFNALNDVIFKLKQKFGRQAANQPELFPEAEEKRWRKMIKIRYIKTTMKNLHQLCSYFSATQRLPVMGPVVIENVPESAHLVSSQVRAMAAIEIPADKASQTRSNAIRQHHHLVHVPIAELLVEVIPTHSKLALKEFVAPHAIIPAANITMMEHGGAEGPGLVGTH